MVISSFAKWNSYRRKTKISYFLVFFFNRSVLSIKCFSCFSPSECSKATLVDCNADTVHRSAQHFLFLSNAQNQMQSPKFNCATYKATLCESRVHNKIIKPRQPDSRNFLLRKCFNSSKYDGRPVVGLFLQHVQSMCRSQCYSSPKVDLQVLWHERWV